MPIGAGWLSERVVLVPTLQHLPWQQILSRRAARYTQPPSDPQRSYRMSHVIGVSESLMYVEAPSSPGLGRSGWTESYKQVAAPGSHIRFSAMEASLSIVRTSSDRRQ